MLFRSVPFISGKDSLNNEYAVKGKSQAIPGTLLISALAVMDDVKRSVSMYLKKPGNLIYVIGETYDELGGSHYYDLFGAIGNNVPKVRAKKARKTFETLSRVAHAGFAEAIHDCSDGGIGVAAAEMAFSGGLGMELFLSAVPYTGIKSSRDDFVLFSESNSRFIVDVEKKNQKRFESLFKGLPLGLAGCVSQSKEFKVYGLNDKVCLKADVNELKEAWKEPLRW